MSHNPREYKTQIPYDEFGYSGKTKRFMAIAKRIAWNSEAEDYKHGALLVKGGKIINVSFNKNNYCSFGCRFRHVQPGNATIHAEIGAILGIDRSVTAGSTIYVCRIGKNGDYRLSKPCPMCHEVLKFVGVKRVVWTINNQTCGSYKIK